MKKKLLLTLMSLFLVVNSPSNPLYWQYEGNLNKNKLVKVEHVEKVDSAQAVFMNKKIALENCKVVLTSEVEKYIRKNTTRKFDKDISSHIVKECLDNDIDICFALAQAQNETCFGTIGIGKSRKSMYGVYKTYKHRNHSTTAYIDLLKTKYLGKKKTIHHLMNNFVNLNGHRYSSNKNYERELKRTYECIKKKTKIFKLQNECNKLME